jgi:cysteine desulfuration protein SufE
MTLSEKQAELMQELRKARTPQDRLAYLVRRAREQPRFDPEFRTEEYRVEGCLSRLWLVMEFKRGRCYFRSDSDSLIVKGIAGLLCDFFSGHTPGAIVAHDPSFLAEAGINQHLTPNRRNALSRVWESIRGFAEAHLPGKHGSPAE